MNPPFDSTLLRSTGTSELQTPTTSGGAQLPLEWSNAMKASFKSGKVPSQSKIDEHLHHVITQIPGERLTSGLLMLAAQNGVPLPEYTRSNPTHESLVHSITKRFQGPKATLATGACTTCRDDKVKCHVSDNSQMCDHCKETGSSCIFPEPKKRGLGSDRTQTKRRAIAEGSPQVSSEHDAHRAEHDDMFRTDPTVLNTSDESQAQTLASYAEGDFHFPAPDRRDPVSPGLPNDHSTLGDHDPNVMTEHAISEVPAMSG